MRVEDLRVQKQTPRGVHDTPGRTTTSIQIACDRCTLGVMDATNPHLWGGCRCECHLIVPIPESSKGVE